MRGTTLHPLLATKAQAGVSHDNLPRMSYISGSLHSVYDFLLDTPPDLGCRLQKPWASPRLLYLWPFGRSCPPPGVSPFVIDLWAPHSVYEPLEYTCGGGCGTQRPACVVAFRKFLLKVDSGIRTLTFLVESALLFHKLDQQILESYGE